MLNSSRCLASNGEAGHSTSRREREVQRLHCACLQLRGEARSRRAHLLERIDRRLLRKREAAPRGAVYSGIVGTAQQALHGLGLGGMRRCLGVKGNVDR